jgi:Co/Zn/Cd efflux system component
MMVVEIVGGTIYGSMAVVADGWHMSTHAAALGIAALAYRFARSHAHDQRFASTYKARLDGLLDLSHVTVEVHRCANG